MVARLPLDRAGRGALYAALIGAPLLLGGRPPWAVAVLELLVLLALVGWAFHMVGAGRLEWRRSALERPLVLLVSLVLLQHVLGNGAVAGWALGPPSSSTGFPTPFFSVGTIAPGVTRGALVVLLTYAAAYVLALNLFRRRRHLETLVHTIIVVGVVLALVGLADHFARDLHLIRWREASRRATSTFVNADHFAAWLNMVIFLGLGALFARGSRRRQPGSPTAAASRFEEIARRYALVAAVAVMALALVFTLSRGAVVAFIVALAVVMVVAAAAGLARRMLVTVSVLLAVTASYAAWLGLAPLLARLHQGDMSRRWAIYVSTLPMVRDFPIFGTGLGTYEHVSTRYQPLALDPGDVLINAAHNDWLQIVSELGPLGLALVVYAIVRVGRDLVGAHLLGRSACPVGGGEGEWARRHDRFSVGIALGAIGGVTSLLVHSLVDFSARMLANGILAAVCLGIATVALHTRFGTEDGFVAAHGAFALPDGRRRRIAAAVACVLAVVIGGYLARPLVTDRLLAGAATSLTPGAVEAAIALDGRDVRALVARAELRIHAARRPSTAGVLPVAERRHEALTLLAGAVADLRAALAATPTDGRLHEKLAWTHQMLWHYDAAEASRHAAAAVAHMHRAVALAPENALVHRALARLTIATFPDAPVEGGLTAAREAIARRPALLADTVYDFLLLPLSDAQWTALVPATAADRLLLGDALEQRGLVREAAAVYRKAIEIGSPADAGVGRFLLGRLLIRQGAHAEALRELGAAGTAQPDNPEFFLAAADALRATRDAAALEMYRATLVKGEERVLPGRRVTRPFPGSDERLTPLIARRVGSEGVPTVVRYRRALAAHLIEREHWLQALAESETLLKDAPRDPLVHALYGRTLEGLGRTDDAIEAYRRAVALEAADTAARMRLARLLWQTRQPNQAINEWHAVLGRDPGNVDAALSLARAYSENGSKQEAFKAYQHVLHIAPDNAEARRALARFGWLAP